MPEPIPYNRGARNPRLRPTPGSPRPPTRPVPNPARRQDIQRPAPAPPDRSRARTITAACVGAAVILIGGMVLANQGSGGNSVGTSGSPQMTTITTPAPVTAIPDLRGTWTGTYTGPPSTSGSRITLSVMISDKFEGIVDYQDIAESATWRETSRSSDTINIYETCTSGQCIDARWAITVNGDTMSASVTWRSDNAPLSDRMSLRRGT